VIPVWSFPKDGQDARLGCCKPERSSRQKVKTAPFRINGLVVRPKTVAFHARGAATGPVTNVSEENKQKTYKTLGISQSVNYATAYQILVVF
jgi:hypothetical protein